MNELIVVIIVLGLLLVLLISIGDLVGAAAFGLVIILLGWVYWRAEIERPRKEQGTEQN